MRHLQTIVSDELHRRLVNAALDLEVSLQQLIRDELEKAFPANTKEDHYGGRNSSQEETQTSGEGSG